MKTKRRLIIDDVFLLSCTSKALKTRYLYNYLMILLIYQTAEIGVDTRQAQILRVPATCDYKLWEMRGHCLEQPVGTLADSC